MISDLDEIPRGMFLYFIKHCSNYINKSKYFPITIDSIVFKYDFGCQFKYQTQKHIELIDKPFIWRHSGLIRFGQIMTHKHSPQFKKFSNFYFNMDEYLSMVTFNYYNITIQDIDDIVLTDVESTDIDTLKLKNLNSNKTDDVADDDINGIITRFETLSNDVDQISHIFNDGHLLHPSWFRQHHTSRHNNPWEELSARITSHFDTLQIELKKMKQYIFDENENIDNNYKLTKDVSNNLIQLIDKMENNILNFYQDRKQIIVINGGWHLSWFFTNSTMTHKIMGLAGDTWKNSPYNHKHLDCFIQQCVHLNTQIFGNRHKFKDNDTFKQYGIKYPQWTVKQALKNNNHWKKLYPTVADMDKTC